MPLIVNNTAAITLLSNSISYLTFLFLEWLIIPGFWSKKGESFQTIAALSKG